MAKKKIKKKVKKAPTKRAKVVKKNAKKKAKKATKRGGSKKQARKTVVLEQPIGLPRIYNGYNKIEARCLLAKKIAKLRAELPEMEATGKHEEKTGDDWQYTIYADVREKIDPLLDKYHIHVDFYADPEMKSETEHDRFSHMVNTYVVLLDWDTGYQNIRPAWGLGENRFWALDSGGTLAMKHALLTALRIRWDNRSAIKAMISKTDHLVGDIVKQVIYKLADKDDPDARQALENFNWKGHK
jgi:hypothetical protein